MASESVYDTLQASLRSVGTAVTLASVGVYLHQRGFVSTKGKRTLAIISQQVTFPLFLFTKIIYCNQDWSSKPCPNVSSTLHDAWMLLLWPIVVVGCGLIVGYWVARLTNSPASQRRSVLAACAFGNSTGIPITLLTVVHANFPASSDLGRIDPTLFLSVYLLLYPVLQWGLGGWLLAPVPTDKPQRTRTITSSLKLNVLNIPDRHSSRKGLSSMDEGLYLSDANLQNIFHTTETTRLLNGNKPVDCEGGSNGEASNVGLVLEEPVSLSRHNSALEVNEQLEENRLAPLMESPVKGEEIQLPDSEPIAKARSIQATLNEIATKCLQPPVIGALLGIFVAATPLRGIFVDLVDRSANAPLQFFFDGLYSVGLSAVPINMMILGCNLSASLTSIYEARKASKEAANLGIKSSWLAPSHMSFTTMVGIVIGKLVVLPIIGITLAVFLKAYVLDIPDDIDGSFYLVVMIVFLTPTANNVMVMVELSGSDTKESIATVIALQYAVAPIMLSGTMAVAIGISSNWS